MTSHAAPHGSRLAFDYIGRPSVVIDLAPDVETALTAVGDIVGWEA